MVDGKKRLFLGLKAIILKLLPSTIAKKTVAKF
jgi:hypothetical protein